MIDSTVPCLLSSSGKGGVGKSTISCLLAAEMSRRMKVGLLDVDVRSPNTPYILGLDNHVDTDAEGHPIPRSARVGTATFPVFSSAFMYGDGTAITMPGTQMRSTIRDMILDTDWPSDIEMLVVDVDPGPGDSLAAVSTTMRDVYAVIVSTSDVSSLQDCAREIDAMENAGVQTLGVIANMVGAVSSCCGEDYVCSRCGSDLKYGDDSPVRDLAVSRGLQLLGTVPWNPLVIHDPRQALVRLAPLFAPVVDRVLALIGVEVPSSTPVSEPYR